jgi:predicted protein tyrosine phosphatase
VIKQVSYTSLIGLSTEQIGPNTAVISVTSPHQKAKIGIDNAGDILHLSFNDRIPDCYSEEDAQRLGMYLFSDAMAYEVIGFCHRLHDSDSPIRLVAHCEFGASRSPAIAKWAAEHYGASLARDVPPFFNDRVYQRLKALSGEPNS